MTGDVNDVIPGSDGLRILEFEKKKKTELRFDARGRKLIFGARRGQTTRWGSDGKVSRERNCLSLLMSKNVKPKKVNKSFVPEPKKKVVKCFVFFGFLCLRTFVNVFRIRMNRSISRVRILVVYFWT